MMGWWLVAACGPAATDDGVDTSPTPVHDSVALTADTAGPEPVAAVRDVRVATDPQHPSLLLLSWQQDVPGEVLVEASVDAGEWWPTPVRSLAVGPASQVVFGVPFGASAALRIGVDRGDGLELAAEVEGTAGPAPEGLPAATVITHLRSLQDPASRFLLFSMDPVEGRDSWALILDRRGRVVWSRKSPPGTACRHPRVSRDGTRLLLDENTFWGSFDRGAASRIVKLTLDEQEAEVIPTPGLHHPFVDLDDGTLLWGARPADDEELLERSPTGELRTVWSCAGWLASIGRSGVCGSNTLSWTPDDHLLYSFYSLDTIVEIDRSSGETVRWFGEVPGGYGFDPTRSQFWWQHGGVLTPSGTLLTSTRSGRFGQETMAREYVIDPEAGSLREVWSYGEGAGIYARVMGEAHRLGNGNTLENFGSATRVQEVTPDGVVVWDVDWDTDVLGRSTFLTDPYRMFP